MVSIEEAIEWYNEVFEGHVGPNGEVVGDIVVCINTDNCKSLSELRTIRLNKKYVILNPDGGRDDLMVWSLDDEFIDDTYYKWERFVNIDKFRQMQLDKLI